MLKNFVEIDAFDESWRINLRVVNQVGGVKWICLFTGDKRQAGHRSPAHKGPADVDAVIIVSSRLGRVFGVSRTVIIRRKHHAAKEIALRA